MEAIFKPINPNTVPLKKLNTGDTMPAIGLGTFGSDKYDGITIANAVKTAIRMGYRHIDCASVYGNEKEIGQALHELFGEGVITRNDLWITSKVWNNMHHNVIEACHRSLNDLQINYLNLYIVHWPFPNYHAEGCSVDSRDPGARPYIHEEFMACWREMEKLIELGLVRNIGTSNMTRPKMELLLKDCKIKPACTEMELHPHFQQRVLFNYMIENEIQPIGFCPIGSPNRPERDKTASDTSPVLDPVINAIADRHNVHPAVVCIKWACQNGQIPIPFSVKPPQLYGNLKCVTEDPLSAEEMNAIAHIDKNCRLIKGQVFTWKGAAWEDLWDENGIIKGW